MIITRTCIVGTLCVIILAWPNIPSAGKSFEALSNLIVVMKQLDFDIELI